MQDWVFRLGLYWIIIEMFLISLVDMDLSFCLEEGSNCKNSTAAANDFGSTVDFLVNEWGYSGGLHLF